MGMCTGSDPQAGRSLQAPGGREGILGLCAAEAASILSLLCSPQLPPFGVEGGTRVLPGQGKGTSYGVLDIQSHPKLNLPPPSSLKRTELHVLCVVAPGGWPSHFQRPDLLSLACLHLTPGVACWPPQVRPYVQPHRP